MTVKVDKTLYREALIERADIDEDNRRVQLAFSSENPVERWFGREILDHKPQSVRLARLKDGGPLLVGHDARDHVGVVEKVSIDDDRKGRVTVRLGKSARADEIFQDVVDGIRRHVSVGYRIHDLVLEESKNDGNEKTYRATDWEPFEVSLVSVPADTTVGVGRSANPDEPINKGDNMPDDDKTQKRAQTDPAPAQDPAPKIDVKVIENEARKAEQTRIRHIQALGDKFDKPELATKYIEEGRSSEEFNDALLKEIEREQADANAAKPAAHLDLTPTETNKYSIIRALRAATNNDWSKAGFELECSVEIAERVGREANGFYVPFDVQIEERQQTAGTNSEGGFLVATEHLASSFIDNLRARSVVMAMGARTLNGLVGNVDIPKKTASAAFGWLAEDADSADTEITLGVVSLVNKTVSGSVPMTRKIMKQSSPDIEALVRDDLVRGAALAIDLAALSGAGTATEPRGIINQVGVNTQAVATPGAPTWPEVVGFETRVNTDDALLGSLFYATTPAVKGNLKTTAKDAGSGLFLMEGEQTNGYPVMTTTQLAANTIIFGNYSDVIIGYWGILDLMPDTATKVASGGLVIRVFQDADVAVRHAESFCINA